MRWLDIVQVVLDGIILLEWFWDRMPRTPTAKNWCFTWNNYPVDYKEQITDKCAALKADHDIEVVYYLCGEEVGESGTPHIQGFLSCDKALSNPAQKLWQSHWSVARSVAASIRYCKKDGEFYDHGEEPKKHGNQGNRSDLHELRDRIRGTFEAGNTYSSAMARDEFPSVAAQYPTFVKESIQDYKPQKTVTAFPLREWQQELNGILNGPANARDCIFIVDRNGNAGKTWFSKYYRSLHENVQCIPPGKYADMAYIVEETTRVFFIDTPREKMEYFNYYFLEKLKDGDVFSSKYVPIHKEWNHDVHVVVLLNDTPDMGKLSQDRYKIVEIT